MLTPRLQAVADFIPPNTSIADIGTDHANLPMFLIKSQKIHHAIAIDVNEGPYFTAKQAVEHNCLNKKIDVRLGSGLSALKPKEADIAVFAGMGGLLINSLLKSSPDIVNSLQGLVLQPQLAAEKVRSYLYTIGWHIKDEALAREQQHIYQIIYAVPGLKSMPDDISLEIGPVILEKRSALFPAHIDMLLYRNKKILAGIERSSAKQASARYNKINALVKKLEMIKSW